MMFKTAPDTTGPFFPCSENGISNYRIYENIIFDRAWQDRPEDFNEQPSFSEPTFAGFSFPRFINTWQRIGNIIANLFTGAIVPIEAARFDKIDFAE